MGVALPQCRREEVGVTQPRRVVGEMCRAVVGCRGNPTDALARGRR